MGMSMVPFLCISHVYLDRIVSSFGFYVYDYECMNIYDLNTLCERFSHIYIHTHVNDDLIITKALRGVLNSVLK